MKKTRGSMTCPRTLTEGSAVEVAPEPSENTGPVELSGELGQEPYESRVELLEKLPGEPVQIEALEEGVSHVLSLLPGEFKGTLQQLLGSRLHVASVVEFGRLRSCAVRRFEGFCT